MDRIIITGTSGYVGSKIVLDFLQKDYKIIGLDLFFKNASLFANCIDFTFFKADIAKVETLPEQLKEANVLIHCAALVHKKSTDLSRENYYRVNCEGTKNILNFLDKDRFKQIIFLSTVSVYGDVSDNIVPNEDTSANPKDIYGESKLAAENVIKEYSDKHKIPYTIFRLTPVYGDFFLLNIKKRIYLPKQLAFYKIVSGDQRLSLVSVNNVVDVVAACINNPLFFNETFIVKDMEDYSINKIISTFKKIYSQKNKPVFRIPLCILGTAFKLLGLVMPEKAKFYEYQLKKIANNNIYSGTRLNSTGIQLKWNLENTLKGIR